MATDKNQATINFLLTCEYIQDSPLYFNFINAKSENKQFLTTANDRTVHRPYIDGSVMKQYTFTIVDFKPISPNPIVNDVGYEDENVENMDEVQGLIDWLVEQADAGNYPDFGSDCVIDNMVVLSDNPNLNGIDTGVKPTLAKYSVSIQITYIDNSKAVWYVPAPTPEPTPEPEPTPSSSQEEQNGGEGESESESTGNSEQR